MATAMVVAEAAARSPEVGVLPFGDARRVALLVSAPETEVETQIETLLACRKLLIHEFVAGQRRIASAGFSIGATHA